MKESEERAIEERSKELAASERAKSEQAERASKITVALQASKDKQSGKPLKLAIDYFFSRLVFSTEKELAESERELKELRRYLTSNLIEIKRASLRASRACKPLETIEEQEAFFKAYNKVRA